MPILLFLYNDELSHYSVKKLHLNMLIYLVCLYILVFLDLFVYFLLFLRRITSVQLLDSSSFDFISPSLPLSQISFHPLLHKYLNIFFKCFLSTFILISILLYIKENILFLFLIFIVKNHSKSLGTFSKV